MGVQWLYRLTRKYWMISAGIILMQIWLGSDRFLLFCSRFLINLPEDEKKDPVKLLTHLELAHWFYLDLLRPEDHSLPACNFKEFIAANILCIIICLHWCIRLCVCRFVHGILQASVVCTEHYRGFDWQTMEKWSSHYNCLQFSCGCLHYNNTMYN